VCLATLLAAAQNAGDQNQDLTALAFGESGALAAQRQDSPERHDLQVTVTYTTGSDVEGGTATLQASVTRTAWLDST